MVGNDNLTNYLVVEDNLEIKETVIISKRYTVQFNFTLRHANKSEPIELYIGRNVCFFSLTMSYCKR